MENLEKTSRIEGAIITLDIAELILKQQTFFTIDEIADIVYLNFPINTPNGRKNQKTRVRQFLKHLVKIGKLTEQYVQHDNRPVKLCIYRKNTNTKKYELNTSNVTNVEQASASITQASRTESSTSTFF